MKTLDDSQVESFDIEYVDDDRWRIIAACIEESFPNGDFTFIDLGGGNGMFADKILEAYPRSQGTVLDNSQLLLDRNQPNSRKKIILKSIEELSDVDNRYDLVCFNWVLHHLVGDSYAQTRSNIDTALVRSIGLLNPEGRLSIFENMYNGALVDNAPSQIIYGLTSSKILAKTIASRANTSGVGVCFLSQKTWESTAIAAGYDLNRYSDASNFWKIPFYWHVLFTLGNIRCGHLWLSPRNRT